MVPKVKIYKSKYINIYKISGSNPGSMVPKVGKITKFWAQTLVLWYQNQKHVNIYKILGSNPGTMISKVRKITKLPAQTLVLWYHKSKYFTVIFTKFRAQTLLLWYQNYEKKNLGSNPGTMIPKVEIYQYLQNICQKFLSFSSLSFRFAFRSPLSFEFSHFDDF